MHIVSVIIYFPIFFWILLGLYRKVYFDFSDGFFPILDRSLPLLSVLGRKQGGHKGSWLWEARGEADANFHRRKLYSVDKLLAMTFEVELSSLENSLLCMRVNCMVCELHLNKSVSKKQPPLLLTPFFFPLQIILPATTTLYLRRPSPTGGSLAKN